MSAPEPLSRVEALILRHGVGGAWMVRWLLTDHAAGVAHAKAGQLGGTFSAPGYDGWWFSTTPKGIGIGPTVRAATGEGFAHFLPWKRIREHIGTLTVAQLDELRDAGAGVQQLARKRADHGRRSYGQVYWLHGAEGPLTLGQDNADEGHRQWWEREPDFQGWERQWAQREHRAVEEAVPIPPAEPAVQGDLLELLGAAS